VSGYEVYVYSAPIRLKRQEFAVLKTLVINRGKVLTRAQLLDLHWPDMDINDRVVDVCICRLRRKLGAAKAYIRSVFGIGYKFSTE
jgi:DNA-binding response OmpR family regulator